MAGDKGKQVVQSKKKSIAGSSSKRPRITTFDEGRFLSYENQERFDKWYLPKKFILEKRIKLDDFPDDSPIVEVALGRSWEKLVTFAEPSSSSIIKEFLANVDRDKVQETRVSWVRGVTVPFHHEFIESFLRTSYRSTHRCGFAQKYNMMQPITSRSIFSEDMPQLADDIRRGITTMYSSWISKPGLDHVPEKLKRQELSAEADFWHQFINHTVMPSSNMTDVNVERAVLLFVLMRDFNLNISRILSNRILHMVQDRSSRSLLSHSSLISHLCRHAGLEIPDDEPRDVPIASDMTPRTFLDCMNRSLGDQLFRGSNLPREEMLARSPRIKPRTDEEEPTPDIPATTPPHTQATPAPPSSSQTSPLEFIHEQSPSYLRIQAQLDAICKHFSIDITASPPQYSPLAVSFPPAPPTAPPTDEDDQHTELD